MLIIKQIIPKAIINKTQIKERFNSIQLTKNDVELFYCIMTIKYNYNQNDRNKICLKMDYLIQFLKICYSLAATSKQLKNRMLQIIEYIKLNYYVLFDNNKYVNHFSNYLLYDLDIKNSIDNYMIISKKTNIVCIKTYLLQMNYNKIGLLPREKYNKFSDSEITIFLKQFNKSKLIFYRIDHHCYVCRNVKRNAENLLMYKMLNDSVYLYIKNSPYYSHEYPLIISTHFSYIYDVYNNPLNMIFKNILKSNEKSIALKRNYSKDGEKIY